MVRGAGVFSFGPFQLDSERRRLMRAGEPVALPDRHVDILLLLASTAGRIVSKNALIEAAWKDVAVSDNSLEQAISSLRKTLGSQQDGTPFIETLARRGYRFNAAVERHYARQSDDTLDALLAPYRAFVEGRAALETLDRDAVTRARQAFEKALVAAPDHPSAHVGMANACVLGFESTRADAVPDAAALDMAGHHAREGCRLDPASGEAWSTLAFVLHRAGDTREAIAAARRAVTVEPDEWRHHLRLASVTWGDERLHAAHRVLKLCPGLALAYWFSASVFVARQAFSAAAEELRPGCASQDAQRRESGRFNAVGLHLLHGLVMAAQGAEERALEEFARELAFEEEGQLYARECCANTWYAFGAIRLRQERHADAAAAFQGALNRVPGHALASIGLAAALRTSSATASRGRPPQSAPNIVDVAMIKSAFLALDGKHTEAARVCGDALAQVEPGPAGWMIPVDPLLHATAHGDAWAQTLAALRDRAA
jgi:DNA-binding winged helix-turn-helix (wHTH) protein/cytochrome c-type biogenesis protein CcmH/NrfG